MAFTGHFRYTVWSPTLIVAQIITIQCIFYASLGLWVMLSDFATGAIRSLDHVFLYEALHFRDLHGRFIIGSYLLNSLVCSLGLWYLVQRTRQCLDFSATAHVLHLLVCWGYNHSFPHSVIWWGLSGACVTIMCVCGEFLCMRTEMKAIPLSMGPKADL